MEGKQIVSYELVKVKEGYVSRCISNHSVASFGKTEEEAGTNLILAIREYLNIYPDKHDKIFGVKTLEYEEH